MGAPNVAGDTALGECAALLWYDFASFAARCFRELNPRTRFAMNWHAEVMAGSPERPARACPTRKAGGRPSGEAAAVRECRTRRLIISVPPRHLKSHLASVAFLACSLGHDPSMQIVCVTPEFSGDGPSRA